MRVVTTFGFLLVVGLIVLLLGVLVGLFMLASTSPWWLIAVPIDILAIAGLFHLGTFLFRESL